MTKKTKTKNNNKILYVMYCEDDYGEREIWLDENKNVVSCYDSNDGTWRDEYFNHIFESVGVTIKRLKYDKKIAEKEHF